MKKAQRIVLTSASLAAAMWLAGCGSSGSTAANPPVIVNPPPPVVGIATPSSVAVVTANNAGT